MRPSSTLWDGSAWESPASSGQVKVAVDNFYAVEDGSDVRASAVYDDFEASPSRTKWRQGERAISWGGGSASFSQSNDWSGGDFDATQMGVFPTAYAVDMTVTAQSGNGIGLFYGPIGQAVDTKGLILAGVVLTAKEAHGFVLECVPAGGDNCGGDISIVATAPLGANAINQARSLFFQWDGSLVAFQIDSKAPVTVNPADAAVSLQPLGKPTGTDAGFGGVAATSLDFSKVGTIVEDLTGSSAITVKNLRVGRAVSIH